jgi:glc operon protein GlcG
MTLLLETAFNLVRYAIKAGSEKDVPIAVAVVDVGGRLMAAARSESVGFVNLNVAQRKANTALNFKAPTHAVLEMLKSDSVALAAVMNEATLCLLPGGFPVVIDGVTVGAFGIAGGHYSQDQSLGEESLVSLGRP